MTEHNLDRYSRQMLFHGIGKAGQEKLVNSTAVVLGCGALGTVIAGNLARAGVGHLRIVDRDFIELNNLQRQILFDEDDIHAGLPKAEAARLKLERVNSNIKIEGVVSDINFTNIEEFIQGADIVLDGTDNFETRFTINDACVKHDKTWVYGAAIGSTGLSMNIIPGETPCLRCLYETAPPPEMSPTCDTAGVLGGLVSIIGSFQATEAIKILVGKKEAMNKHLIHFDIWDNDYRKLTIGTGPVADCPTCGQKNYEYLNADAGSQTTTLCGRNAVQITFKEKKQISFADLETTLSKLGTVNHSKFMLKFDYDGHVFTIFPDGRAIIQGTNDPTIARNLYAKYIGA